MINRYYFCKNCDHEFETVQPMNEKLKKKCPKCKKNKLAQDLSGNFNFSIKTYSTIISVAEKNTKELGTYGREAKEQAFKQKEENIKKQRREKLEQMGYSVPEVKKSPYEIPDAPKEVKQKIKKGDSKGIKDYILKGKV